MASGGDGRAALPPGLAEWIGRAAAPVALPDAVTAADLRRYANAIEDANPLWQDDEYARAAGYEGRIAPPCLPLELTIRPAAGTDQTDEAGLRAEGIGTWDLVVPVPPEYSQRRRAEDEIEWFRDVVPGDRLSVRQRIADIQLKHGRTGEFILIVRENEYLDERGTLVIRQRIGNVFLRLAE